MAAIAALLHRRRRRCGTLHSFPFLRLLSSSSPSPSPDAASAAASPSRPPSLSARLSLVFDQLDALSRSASDALPERDAALRRILSWRSSPVAPPPPPPPAAATDAAATATESPPPAEAEMTMAEVLKRDVEIAHPWPEWVELMERLARQNYFHYRAPGDADLENRVAAGVPVDLSAVDDESVLDFSKDFITVRTAMLNFGRDRFDILRSLSRHDIQILVGHGCPSTDAKVVFSSKLLRKHVHLDEGDVCSSCSLRNKCSRGYILTKKEDEARTYDVMRILFTYGFNYIEETIENVPLLKKKSLKSIARKLIHEVVKLSAFPIDPNLPPPIIKKPPPKVKQPPPLPKKRLGRADVEMKKGDWLCPKCDFMNFAKNLVCMQCDAKRPKRQLLPGEWECPRCNFLNYRRNMSCYHCELERPPDAHTENRADEMDSSPRTRLQRAARLTNVPNACNLNFDDDESDGADVAAFEFAETPKFNEGSMMESSSYRGIATGSDGRDNAGRHSERESHQSRQGRRPFDLSSRSNDRRELDGRGFDDFDDDDDDYDVDNYELDLPKNGRPSSIARRSFSDYERDSVSDSEGFGGVTRRPNRGDDKDDDDDDDIGDPALKSTHVAESWKRATRSRSSRGDSLSESGSDVLDSDSEEYEDDVKPRRKITRNSPISMSVDEASDGGYGYNDDDVDDSNDDDDDVRSAGVRKGGGHFTGKFGSFAEGSERRGGRGSRPTGSRGGFGDSRERRPPRGGYSPGDRGRQENRPPRGSYSGERGRREDRFPRSAGRSGSRGSSAGRYGGGANDGPVRRPRRIIQR